MNPNYRHDDISPGVQKAVEALTTVLLDVMRAPPPEDPREGLNSGAAIEHAIKDLVVAARKDCTSKSGD